MNTETLTVRAMCHGTQEVVRGRVPIPASREESLAILGGIMGDPEWDGVWDGHHVDLVGLVDEVADVEDLVSEAIRDAMHGYLAGGSDDSTAEDIARGYLLEDYSPEEIRRGVALWWSMTREEQRATIQGIEETLTYFREMADAA
jgi:hypothetical protein